MLNSFNHNDNIHYTHPDIDFLNRKNINFNKLDTFKMKEVFGNDFELGYGWSSLKDWDRTTILGFGFYLYEYSDLDIRFIYRIKEIDAFSNKIDTSLYLTEIQVHSCFQGKVFDDIEMGITKNRDLPEKVQKIAYDYRVYGGKMLVSKSYKNFIFHSKIEDLSSLESKDSIEYLKPIFDELTVDFIRIITPIKKRQAYCSPMSVKDNYEPCEDE